jgi:hypothetical protein
VDLSIGRELAGLALLSGLLATVMWLLALTKRRPVDAGRSLKDRSRVRPGSDSG